MRRVFITGALRGLAPEFCRQYLDQGDAVVPLTRDPENARALKALKAGSPDRIEIVRLDMKDRAAIAVFGNNQAKLKISDSATRNLLDVAADYLGGTPQLIFINPSHQLAHTIEELNFMVSSPSTGRLHHTT